MAAANSLKDGYCGLTDGSKAGQWHLPNVKEMQSLFYYGEEGWAISNTEGDGPHKPGDPFYMNYVYWTSTNSFYGRNEMGFAYCAGFEYGSTGYAEKTYEAAIWAVRGPKQ